MKAYCALVLLFGCVALASSQGDNIFCYFGAWSKWHQGVGKYTIKDMNPKLCTHIAYAFIGLTDQGAIDTLGATDDFPTFQNLKKENPNVKLIISMGGWNEGSTKFSDVTGNDNLRSVLVQNIYNFVTSNNLDGIDIDWEYPTQRGGKNTDRQSYIKFLKDLKAKFGPKGLLVTAAVGALVQETQYTSYDVPNMNKYLDFFNIMTYDYHGNWDPVIGYNSPLFPSPHDNNKNLNMEASIKGWIAAGADPSKILTGLAFYGHSFTLANPSDTTVGAAKNGPGQAGPFTQQGGTLEYLEICMLLKQGGWTTLWDDASKVPYSFKGNQWIGYDNVKSLELKVNWAKSMKLGGVMVWSIDEDDPHNVCGQGNSPLLTAVYETVHGHAPAPEPIPTAAPTKPTAAPPSTPTSSPVSPTQSPVGGTCKQQGYLRDKADCTTFYNCVPNGSGGFTPYEFHCPSGLVFNVNTDNCDYPSNVPGCN